MKLCDFCGKNPGIVLVKVLDKEGNAVELMICADCGRKRGLSGVEKTAPKKEEADSREPRAESRNFTCPSCGLSFSEFKRRGRLGCANCYNAFEQELKQVIRRIHGSIRHTGKEPNKGRKKAQERLEVQRLRAELDAAIKEEDYERAAALRDLLRQTENEVDT